MIKRGDIILTHSPVKSFKDIALWFIRKITGSYWSHAAWALGPDLAIEAQAGGVRIVPVSVYTNEKPNHFCILRIHPDFINQKQTEHSLLKAQTYKGKKYDWWLILQLFWLYLTGSRKIKEAGDWDNSWICSELIARPLFEEGEFRFTDKVPVGNIVPSDIRKSDKVFLVMGNEVF